MRLRFSRMAAVLTLGVAGVIMGAFSIGAYFHAATLYDEMVTLSRDHAQAQAEMMRVALEQQMLQKDRSAIDAMVRSFASDPLIDTVMVLDGLGRLKYTSNHSGADPLLDVRSPTCQACHRDPAERRNRSTLIDTADGEMLRVATPIRNRPACHACHDPERRMNGLLLVDVKIGTLKKKLGGDIRRMVVVSGLLALIAIAGISLTIRLAFLRRLKRFERVARAIAAGDLTRRLPNDGDDTLAWLARQFNRLTDSVTGLLDDVQQRSRQLERVIDGLSDGIMVLDPEGRIVAANAALLERAGRPRDEVIGKLCHEVMRHVCGENTPCSIRSCLAACGRESMIVQRRTADGQVRHEEVQASAVRAPDGTVEYIVESWRDITSRRAAEAQLAESHRLASLGMLASGFSHELNTPLATTLACVEGIGRTAAEEPVDLAYIAESARIAKEQLLRGRAITQQFLRLARGESSGEDLIDLGATLPAIVRLVEPTAREHKVELRAAPCLGAVFVRVCEAEVQQVLLNLILNAVQACEAGGHVQVTCRSSSVIAVDIRDDGRGISPEEQERILEPFYSRRAGGTGLGLFISLQMTRRWGGELLVASEPGAGSTFTVTFPFGTEGPAETGRQA